MSCLDSSSVLDFCSAALTAAMKLMWLASKMSMFKLCSNNRVPISVRVFYDRLSMHEIFLLVGFSNMLIIDNQHRTLEMQHIHI